MTSSRTLADWLAIAASEHAESIGIIHHERELSWREVEVLSRRAAKGLLALGVTRGDRVAIWLPNIPEWLILWLGAARIGAAAVPLNTRYKADEAGYVLWKSGASTLFLIDHFVGVDYQKLFAQIRPGGQTSSSSPHPLDALANVVVVGYPALEHLSLDQFLDGGDSISDDALAQAEARVSAADLMIIVFTSGTTGYPKGVMHDHRVLPMLRQLAVEYLEIDPTGRVLGHMPLFHCGGSFSCFGLALMTGAAIVLVERWEPDLVLPLIEKHKVSTVSGTPTHFIDLLTHPRLGDYDLSSLRSGWIGGSGIPAEVITGARERLGMHTLLPIYGMTETTSVITLGRRDDPMVRVMAGKGKPIGGYDLCLVDPQTGAAVRPGTEGLIKVRGYMVTRGYFRDPEATAAAFDDDGWFITNDLGVLDEDGYLQITGRLSDKFIVGGNNVHPAEIERVLMGHDAVKQAYVVHKPDPRLGDVGVAFVELQPQGAQDANQLIDYCKQRLASFKVPREIIFVDEWPMTPTGKVQKYRLRELAIERGAT
jgi:fatty-acyl-CoA synthase